MLALHLPRISLLFLSMFINEAIRSGLLRLANINFAEVLSRLKIQRALQLRKIRQLWVTLFLRIAILLLCRYQRTAHLRFPLFLPNLSHLLLCPDLGPRADFFNIHMLRIRMEHQFAIRSFLPTVLWVPLFTEPQAKSIIGLGPGRRWLLSISQDIGASFEHVMFVSELRCRIKSTP